MFNRFGKVKVDQIVDGEWWPWEFMITQLKMISWSSLLVGLSFIITGVLILVFPDLLAWLAASFFIMLGILAIAWGLRFYSVVRTYRKIRPW